MLIRVDEALVSRTLADLGYERVKRFGYRASWSTEEVEHFLYFDLWGTPRNFLTAYFGLRNPRAEAFGDRSILALGGYLYHLRQYDARTHCWMKFSLGMLAGWQPRSSIYLPDVTGPEIAETITASVRGGLFPLVANVTTADRLLTLLLTDGEPFLWARTNGSVRAALIVDLARQLGMPSEKIRAVLKPYRDEIGVNLSRAPDPNPDSYIEKILADSLVAAESS